VTNLDQIAAGLNAQGIQTARGVTWKAVQSATPSDATRVRHQDQRKFDDSTRDAIGRWQKEHAYPKTGFLNTAQHEALLSEGVPTEAGKPDHQDRRRAMGRAHNSRRAGGPIGAIGGAVHHVVGGVVGLFHR
jgi:hypothetical protein